MFYLRHYITVARCGFVHYILKTNYAIFFFKLYTVIGHHKRKNFYNFWLSVAILDFQWLFILKVVGEMVKNVIESDFWSNGQNKNGRVAIFITTMADGGHLFFLSTVLIWNGEQCNKKFFFFSFIFFYEKHLGQWRLNMTS